MIATASSERVTTGASLVLASRALRSVVDGAVSVLLTGYLSHLGFSPVQIGQVVTSTLLGSGLITLGTGLLAHRFSRRSLLVASGLLMACTGVAFAWSDRLWVLLLVAFVGTLNPSSGDVSVFLPLEQAALAASAPPGAAQTGQFARYNVIGTFAAALGALSAGVPDLAARLLAVTRIAAERAAFLIYAAVGAAVAWLYTALPDDKRPARPSRALARSRSTVFRLAALFSLDAFGGGFVVQSLLALWLLRRYQLSLASAGAFFFASSLAGALSQFMSPRVASRVGLVRTMVYTHIPANLFLIAAAFMPTLGSTMALLLLRASVSSMDVPARQAYVMSVVPPEERAAAASVTNVPRSLASAIPPLLTGIMLEHSSFGWPLICAGSLKLTYDIALLVQFRSVRPHATGSCSSTDVRAR